ncbi:MAG TPA: PilZ domain-containing protein [Candidatus Baltobacteraceae bacterium]|nr:PilZ domain-containing protein [Candidatus Baltobacteraceae bacterium]
MNVEQRAYPRFKPPKSILGAWRSGMQREVSYVENLAIGGVFLRTKRKVALRSLVQVLLDMPVGQVRGRGVVRRHQEHHGIAVQFIAMDPEDRGRLLRQIRELTVSAT